MTLLTPEQLAVAQIEIQRSCAKSGDIRVRRYAASSPLTPVDVLIELSGEKYLIKEQCPDAENGSRGLLQQKRLELDIYIPSLKKAIEYDGTYWHSLPGCQEKDQRKNEQCVQAGIQLLRVSDRDYEADPTGTTDKVLAWLTEGNL